MKKHRHTINVLLTVTLILMSGVLLLELWWFLTDPNPELRHYLGVMFTVWTLIALFINQNVFTLLVGLTLAIGNFGGLACSVPISTYYIGFNIGSLPIPLYWGQPEYSLLLFIYLIFNKEFFIGILTKAYWKDFINRTEDLKPVLTVIPIKTHQADPVIVNGEDQAEQPEA